MGTVLFFAITLYGHGFIKIDHKVLGLIRIKGIIDFMLAAEDTSQIEQGTECTNLLAGTDIVKAVGNTCARRYAKSTTVCWSVLNGEYQQLIIE